MLLYYYHGVQQYLVRSNNGVGHPSTIARAGALIFKDPFVGAECESLSNTEKKLSPLIKASLLPHRHIRLVHPRRTIVQPGTSADKEKAGAAKNGTGPTSQPRAERTVSFLAKPPGGATVGNKTIESHRGRAGTNLHGPAVATSSKSSLVFGLRVTLRLISLLLPAAWFVSA